VVRPSFPEGAFLHTTGCPKGSLTPSLDESKFDKMIFTQMCSDLHDNQFVQAASCRFLRSGWRSLPKTHAPTDTMGAHPTSRSPDFNGRVLWAALLWWVIPRLCCDVRNSMRKHIHLVVSFPKPNASDYTCDAESGRNAFVLFSLPQYSSAEVVGVLEENIYKLFYRLD